MEPSLPPDPGVLIVVWGLSLLVGVPLIRAMLRAEGR